MTRPALTRGARVHYVADDGRCVDAVVTTVVDPPGPAGGGIVDLRVAGGGPVQRASYVLPRRRVPGTWHWPRHGPWRWTPHPR
ncbi:hypothetical protein [Amycolatopsis arida]|uniref:hypothetical protein n=1 Tax=Amycolatopsis arida TaxID=587909 RepID=UPI00106512FD|nr:hypothetical protein [Amycolatopsis arida]TDX84925.1 hypothetical protein CLV69_1179 [Amycolatopsis arida]